MPAHADATRTTRPDRRTVLAAVSGLGAGLLTGVATARQDALELAYHTARENVIGRPFVVYREPAPETGRVCELDDAVRHPVVAPGGQRGTAVYADLAVARRFAPGTVLLVVDRVQGCESAGESYTGVFVELVGEPPDGRDDGDDRADHDDRADDG